jgi:proteasome assembly chaperone (PAC2) family protein
MIEFIHYRDLDVKKPVFLYCVGGGMGNVARLVGYKLIKTFNAKKTTTILLDCYPDVVYSTKRGILRVPKLSIYTFEENNQDYVVLYGEMQPNLQPFDSLTRYRLSYRLLKFVKKLNVKEIVSLGGYGVEIEPEKPKLYFSANSTKIIDALKSIFKEEFNLYRRGTVAGMSGLLVALAKYFKIPAYLILSETYPTASLYGYFGASKLLEALKKIYQLEVDYKDYLEKGSKLKKKIEKQLNIQSPQKSEQLPKRNIYYFG